MCFVDILSALFILLDCSDRDIAERSQCALRQSCIFTEDFQTADRGAFFQKFGHFIRKLPDIERQKQEKVLNRLCEPSVFYRLQGIENASISQFMSLYFEVILEVWASVGEIKDTQISAIKCFAQNYAQNGYPGVLKYKFDNYARWKNPDQTDFDFVNDTYKEVFRNVKDTIEYQLPRIISLFETLINRAYELKNCPLAVPLDLSKIIRYFEVGAQTELGIDMVERGVPVITVRKIEKKHIQGDTLSEQKQHFKDNVQKYMYALDNYEKHLTQKYVDEQC